MKQASLPDRRAVSALGQPTCQPRSPPRQAILGREYADERADALLPVAFDRLNLELVVAAHIDGDEKS